MNPIQLAIIAGVVILIMITIGYYWYQEAKFKKMVEKNFNQATNDVITEENKPIVLDGINLTAEKKVTAPILAKDVHIDNAEDIRHIDSLFGEANHQDNTPGKEGTIESAVPEDSVEAIFAQIDKLGFPFAETLDADLDLVIDMVFEEPKKLKVLPEITQFTHKPFIFYVLDKENQWHAFTKGTKYVAQALKLVVELVDKEGIISQAQIANIYNELHKFVLQNQGHIRKSDYEASIAKIQRQIKHLADIELELCLYLVLKEPVSYEQLAKFFDDYGLNQADGRFSWKENNSLLFVISNENGLGLKRNEEYNLLSINANLHLCFDPLKAVDKAFDCAERFMQQFESRLLTTNKQIFAQKDYDVLNRYVTNYVTNAKKNGIKLGGTLLQRLF